MAVLDAIFTPVPISGNNFTLAATTASAEQVTSHNRLITIWATGTITVRLGPAGSVTNPTAANNAYDFAVPGNAVLMFDMGPGYDSFKVYNPGGATVTVYWSEFAR